MSHRLILKEIIEDSFHVSISNQNLDQLWISCCDYLEKINEHGVIEHVEQCSVYPLSEDDRLEVQDAVAHAVIGQHWPMFRDQWALNGVSKRQFRTMMAQGLNKKFDIKAKRIHLSTHRVIQIHSLGDEAESKARVYSRGMDRAKQIGNNGAYRYFERRYTKMQSISKTCARRLAEQA